jgi:hypothetical protein
MPPATSEDDDVPSKPAFFYLDEQGVRRDAALHAEMLDNPEADGLVARDAIERQVAAGMALELAVDLYGTPAMRQAVGEGRPPY